MAEDVSRPEPDPLEGPREESGLLPDRRRSEDHPERSDLVDNLPERRGEPATGELDRWRGGPPPSTYAPRFRALTGGLVGLAIGALVATSVALFGRSFEPGPRWSTWQPSKADTAGAEEIAKHVAPAYKLPTGDQMVLATGGPLKVAGLDIPVRIAVSGQAPHPISEIRGQTVQYQLCGLGERCAIDKGKPSLERGLLLHREALELALYSFHYLKGIDNVVVLLPPAPGQAPQNAMLFRKPQLEGALARPLTATLPHPPPSVTAVDDSPETGIVKQLTGRNLFQYSFEQSQDFSAILVLKRRSPQ